MRRTDRLFELVQLFRGGRLRTGQALAERLGVSLRTIYRDIDTLIASGIPIEGERGVGYVLREPIFLPPLTLTPVELEALHLGVALVRQTADPELVEAAGALMTKVDSVLPSDRPRFGHDWGFAVYGPMLEHAALDALVTLRKAIGRREKLRLAYRSLSDEVTERVVRPLQVEYWGRVWTCTAWCELRHDFRVFRLDRVLQCAPTGDRFTAEKGKRLADYHKRLEAEGWPA